MPTGFSLLSSGRFSLVRHFTARSPVLTESGPVQANLLEAWGLKVARQNKLLEKSRFTLTKNGRREFVPRDQVFPLFSIYSLLLLHKNKQFYPSHKCARGHFRGDLEKNMFGCFARLYSQCEQQNENWIPSNRWKSSLVARFLLKESQIR